MLGTRVARPMKVPAARAPVSRDAVVRCMRGVAFVRRVLPLDADRVQGASTWAHASNNRPLPAPVSGDPRGLRGGHFRTTPVEPVKRQSPVTIRKQLGQIHPLWTVPSRRAVTRGSCSQSTKSARDVVVRRCRLVPAVPDGDG